MVDRTGPRSVPVVATNDAVEVLMSQLPFLSEPVVVPGLEVDGVTAVSADPVLRRQTEAGGAGDHRGVVAGRLSGLQGSLAEAGVDAVLVSCLANVRYLTGFTGSAAQLAVLEDQVLLTTDGRYRAQVAEQVRAAGVGDLVDVVVGGVQVQRDAVVDAVGRGAGRRVGLEADHVSWAGQRRWAESLPEVTLVATSGLVEKLRAVKDATEIAAMARAAAIADAALAEVLVLVAPGHSEQAVAQALDSAMRRLGAEDRAFETIVASGPNSAMPHARPTDRLIAPGDAVVVDFGATADGYRSDMTRTFLVGHPEAELAEIWALVAKAQAAGVAAVQPGVSAGEVDGTCRHIIDEAGRGDQFEHGTGHGVGLDIHEAPSVSSGSTAILVPGTVVTVEPGVYVAGLGGVRIEDTVVVTSDGCRPLTRFPKEPVLLRT